MKIRISANLRAKRDRVPGSMSSFLCLAVCARARARQNLGRQNEVRVPKLKRGGVVKRRFREGARRYRGDLHRAEARERRITSARSAPGNPPEEIFLFFFFQK